MIRPETFEHYDAVEIADAYRHLTARRWSDTDYDLHAPEIAAVERAFARNREMGWRAVMALISDTFASATHADS